MIMKTEFDYIAIGGGSGGIAAAASAAKHGASVALVEPRELGGTCVNRGCVPKKGMWYAAEIAHHIQLANDYGFNATRGDLNWQTLIATRDNYIHNIHHFYDGYLDRLKITHLKGYGQFIDPQTIAVNGIQYHAPHIVIAPGGAPTVPDIPGAELGITSDGFFELQQQPKKVLIAGSGYIAVEIAGLLNALGSTVTLAFRKEAVLRSFDPMLSEALMEQMVLDGIDLRKLHTPEKVIRDSNGSLTISFQSAPETCCTLEGFDEIIWAIGRTPTTDSLNLSAAGLKVNKRGYIDTDEFQNTAVEGIYAIGDVTGRAQLTPVAISAGRRLSRRLFNGENTLKVDYSNIPSVIFSHPPIGSIGMSEIEAVGHFGENEVKVYTSRFTPMLTALTSHRQPAAMKLVCQGEQEKIVGLHVIGAGADEMLQGFAVAIKMGASKADFDNTIAIHPTGAEEFVTM